MSDKKSKELQTISPSGVIQVSEIKNMNVSNLIKFCDEDYVKALKLTPDDIKNIGRYLGFHGSGDFKSVPMVCLGDACSIAAQCPLQAAKKAPLGNLCHPPGELIYTIQDGYVPVEKLNPSKHGLIGWDRKHGVFVQGRQGAKKGYSFSMSSHGFNGCVVTLLTKNNHSHKVTYDHISAAKFNENAIGKFCVYLMKRGRFWRIGKTKLIHRIKNSTHGHKLHMNFASRAVSEDADKLWILGVYNTNTEAYLAEEYYSLKTQTSRLSFIDSLRKVDSKWDGVYKWATPEQMRKHHESLLQDDGVYDLFLNSLGLSIEYPMWKKGRFSNDPEMGPYVKWPMFIRACNIISGVMDVPTFEDKKSKFEYGYGSTYEKTKWVEVSVKKENYKGLVYSLDVDKHKTYVAGGIATHNCPFEQLYMEKWRDEYIVSLKADWDDKIERALVMELVEIDILNARANAYLATEGFIMENVVGINEQTGEALIRKEEHIALSVKTKVQARRDKILKSMVATRESKTKLFTSMKDDASTYSAKLREHARQLKEQHDVNVVMDGEIKDVDKTDEGEDNE